MKLLSPAVRRPRDDRQRHGLLVDLRRQPADDAIHARRADGRGPAWSNSLFEDNAEFAHGMRLTLDKSADTPWNCLRRPSKQDRSARSSADAIIDADQSTEQGIEEQRSSVEARKEAGSRQIAPHASSLLSRRGLRW